MAGAATAGRPRSARGGSSKTNLAYDLGRRGETAPAWLGDDPRYADAYEDGVSDRDAAGGVNTGPRPKKPQPAAQPRAEPKGADVVPIRPDVERDAPKSSPGLFAAPMRTVGSSVASASGSVGSAVLGAFAYALLINLINGTAKGWLSAKWTNGRGSLP